jgi:hypothetical protein
MRATLSTERRPAIVSCLPSSSPIERSNQMLNDTAKGEPELIYEYTEEHAEMRRLQDEQLDFGETKSNGTQS